MLEVLVKCGATPTGEKAAHIYFYGSEDGTDFTDNATGSDAALTMRDPTNLRGPFVVNCPNSSATDYKVVIGSVAAFFGGVLPREWGFVCHNKTGVTMVTGGTASYTGIEYTVA